ncbi:DUF2946 domain-containing protein [Pseudomonas stutzeri]|nr:DUF2946 domain-containing protein [Stutzerimonas degradans]
MTRKGLSTLSIWLGLFAMLMIHVGPLYSALQVSPPEPAVMGEHHHAAHEHAEEGAPVKAVAHHRALVSDGPAWLTALELCGYCELLTLNPPLTLSVDLALPLHRPAYFHALPQAPLPSAERRSSGHPRAPPYLQS